jgi:hypothetical protein
VVEVMREIFDLFEECTGIYVFSPKTEGGEAYVTINDCYYRGLKWWMYDVSGMEGITPYILAYGLGGFPATLGLWHVVHPNLARELLSGVSPTSDFDMIAHLGGVVGCARYPEGTPQRLQILGDDGSSDKPIHHPVYGLQAHDTRIHRSLGMCHRKSKTSREMDMFSVGANITIDNRLKVLRYILSVVLEIIRTKKFLRIYRQQDEYTQSSGESYIGMAGQYRLIDVIKHLPPGKIENPTEYIVKFLANPLLHKSHVDV